MLRQVTQTPLLSEDYVDIGLGGDEEEGKFINKMHNLKTESL